ncbi:MRG family protein [Chloropicon primus]|uniref:MRG family protein n=1 Tax=Chloropicon primus TaxID=1764295 RepID=A0A5B8MFP4_9CHLO|nr:MRG family protein [Chloropicon primus]UPQ98339.1 MRG family protein [Chloropicon primus]|mmetsp:Transcript_6948/g.20310  ORF Transcript_6948/g.20310 Transcript_6948/m.20310 type:complete len:251 (+) Transcript_6948:254-1006(+)|eukprot:QDZ19131.1 MRG family protein [Chloropicon primus]
MAEAIVAGGGDVAMGEAGENPYAEGDRVLIPQQNLVYEAKIEKVAYDAKSGFKYFVHYMGWNKKYDEWLSYASLKKFDESVKLAKPSFKKGGKKVEDEDYENMAKIPLPNVLKNTLVSEWDAVVRDNKLIPLPKKKHTVAQILDQYCDLVERREPWPEIVDGLKGYFDKTLQAMLLYPQEVKQAQDLLRDGKSASDVYGVEHLVRLFVKLPEILPYTNLDEEGLTQLIARLQAVLNFIKENADVFYSPLK